MSSEDKISQALAYQHAQAGKIARGAVPDPDDVADPSWPYGDESGPPYNDPQDDVWPGNTADQMKLADFTVGPREMLCQDCWQIHRREIDCEGIPR